MGILSGLLGHASDIDVASLEEEFARILGEGEAIERAYQLVRDLMVFTNRRLVLVDRQGVTGKKVEYHSIPYRAITHFSVETAGTLDMEAELKIWISSTQTPVQKTFRKNKAIHDVHKALGDYAL